MESTEQKVMAAVAEILGVELGDVSPEKRLGDDLGVDSMYLIEIAMSLEEKFRVEITDDEIGAVETVQQLIELVQAKLPA